MKTKVSNFKYIDMLCGIHVYLPFLFFFKSALVYTDLELDHELLTFTTRALLIFNPIEFTA